MHNNAKRDRRASIPGHEHYGAEYNHKISHSVSKENSHSGSVLYIKCVWCKAVAKDVACAVTVSLYKKTDKLKAI